MSIRDKETNYPTRYLRLYKPASLYFTILRRSLILIFLVSENSEGFCSREPYSIAFEASWRRLVATRCKETELLLRFSLNVRFSRFISIFKIYYKNNFIILCLTLCILLQVLPFSIFNSWENQIWTSGSHIPYLAHLLVVTDYPID